MENVRNFEMLTENKCWSILREANGYQATAQSLYLALLGELESMSVAFEDIRNYLLKQAKVAGLYQKNVWNEKTGQKDYPSKNFLKQSRPAWFVAYHNFNVWVSANYTGYGRKIDQAKVREEQKKAKEAKKQTVLTRTKTEDGAVVETRTDIVASTVDMSQPIEAQLTVDQLVAIVMNNLSILAGEAEAKGATAEFNALMKKMGRPHDCIIAEVAAN